MRLALTYFRTGAYDTKRVFALAEAKKLQMVSAKEGVPRSRYFQLIMERVSDCAISRNWAAMQIENGWCKRVAGGRVLAHFPCHEQATTIG